ncbi:uncharacterized protein LOC131154908 isoform X2 [Malania oleifera]|uniref:uncharacterized protein LOC131154908 isoform X2 n=2 Tax=Malania oleifera TaxID=397392 RepID=UPI0025AEC669|nr:uncharacterized protein LOC131154908 isoform X2 [Malania oleifera]
MASLEQEEEEEERQQQQLETSNSSGKLLSTYLGLSFSIFLSFLPRASLSLIPTLQSRNRELSMRLLQAEEQLRQMKSRRKEDSKANARVVEIFASHRNAWQQEEKRLLEQIDASAEEIARLRAKLKECEQFEAELKGQVDGLRREVSERDEMLNFMSRKAQEFEDYDYGSVRVVEELDGGCAGGGGGPYACVGDSGDIGGDCYGDVSRFGKIRASEGLDPIADECFLERNRNAEEIAVLYGQNSCFSSDMLPSASKLWAERAGLWQDIQCESLESLYHAKHFVARRESPWKVDGESTGIASKLKLLEQELLNLERIGKSDLSKVPSLMRKQAKRYQALAGKIDDLCQRMVSDPCESTLSTEFRTKRQTEFLLEAFRLQQRASETGQKLMALQTEAGKGYSGDELGDQAKLATRRSLNSIRNNFKEIQRNLEIWLARIIGDLEGILARDGASRVREYYMSRYPFVQ